MSIASSTGETFLFTPQSVGQMPIDGRGRTAIANQGSALPSIGQPRDELEAKDQLVENYLTSWGNLDAFAKHAKKKYGIDVTAPDLSNPLQKKMYSTFMKHYAATESAGNALQRGKEMADLRARMAATQPDFIDTTPQDPMAPTTGAGFGNTGLKQNVESIIRSTNRSFTSGAAYQRAKAEKAQAVKSLQNAIAGATDVTERQELEANLKALEAANPDYDPRIPRPDTAAAKKAGKRDSAFARHRTLDQIIDEANQTGTVDWLNKNTQTKGATWELLDEPDRNGLYLIDNDSGEVIDGVDFTGKDRTHIESKLNQMINERSGQDDVSEEDLTTYRNPYWDALKQGSGMTDENATEEDFRTLRPEIQLGTAAEIVNDVMKGIQEPKGESFATVAKAIQETDSVDFILSGSDIGETEPELYVTRIEPATNFFGQKTGKVVVRFEKSDGSEGKKTIDPNTKSGKRIMEKFVKENFNSFRESMETGSNVAGNEPQEGQVVLQNGIKYRYSNGAWQPIQ